MQQWWQVWRSYFSADDCDRIISIASKFTVIDGTIGHGADKTVVDNEIRRSKIRWVPRFDPNFYSIFGQMELLFAEANTNAFGFDLGLFREVQFTEYHAEDEGHYDWHHDTFWATPRNTMRKLSMVIQLSPPDSYEGGQLELDTSECQQNPGPELFGPRGSVIIFPSFLKHRVTPVTRGLRYSLVTWKEGPCFR